MLIQMTEVYYFYYQTNQQHAKMDLVISLIVNIIRYDMKSDFLHPKGQRHEQISQRTNSYINKK